MRKILLIKNPVAGKGKKLSYIDKLIAALEKDNIAYELITTKYVDHARIIAKEYGHEFTDIIAMGGDGTLLEVANGLTNNKAILGILPIGTGNDFVRSVYGNVNIDDIIDRIVKGESKEIDLGRIEDKLFLNVAGIGIDSDILKLYEHLKKYISGGIVYTIATIISLLLYRSKRVKITIDGKEYYRSVMLVAFGNGQYFGGGMKITPEAKIDDGLFDICIVNRMMKVKFLLLFQKVFKGEHLGVSQVEYLQGKHIRIESSESIIVNMDGNLIGKTPIDIENLPHKILFIK